MTTVEPITDEAGYKRAQARIRELMNNWSDATELEEQRALAEEVTRYSMKHHRIWQVETDGADELEFQLDQEATTLGELTDIFGSIDALIAYMTRRRMPDAATKNALASKLSIDRDFLDAPFQSPPGWQDIDLEGDMHPEEWRAKLLAHRDAMEQKNTHKTAPEPQLAAL